jgi:hypothetical protein
MAYKITAICDKCKKEEMQEGQWFDKDKNRWQEVKFEISQYEYRNYLFCFDCRKKLGLVKENSTEKVHIETVADKLIGCISEIVTEQMQAG